MDGNRSGAELTGGVMGYVQRLTWPSIPSFALVWLAVTVVTWILICLLAIVFMYSLLHAGLVPTWIMLILAVIPIAAITLTVQTVLFLVGILRWPDVPETGKRLVLLGTPLLTWLILCIVTVISGGPSSFVIRI